MGGTGLWFTCVLWGAYALLGVRPGIEAPTRDEAAQLPVSTHRLAAAHVLDRRSDPVERRENEVA